MKVPWPWSRPTGSTGGGVWLGVSGELSGDGSVVASVGTSGTSRPSSKRSRTTPQVSPRNHGWSAIAVSSTATTGRRSTFRARSAGSGNDGTEAPFVPASLAAALPEPSEAQVPPVSSVGASNPDGSTVALFSNPLTVITAVRPGVSLVSTLPLTDGMGQPSSSVAALTGVRCTVDPDDYTGGFGLWSGTSFATPVFAAEVATALVAAGPLKTVTAEAMRKRAVAALRSCTGKDMM